MVAGACGCGMRGGGCKYLQRNSFKSKILLPAIFHAPLDICFGEFRSGDLVGTDTRQTVVIHKPLPAAIQPTA